MECKQRSVSDISDAGQIVTQLHCRIYPTWGSEGVKQSRLKDKDHMSKTMPSV